MEIHAQSSYIRMSPRKVRLIVEAIKYMPLTKAMAHLRLMNKRASGPVEKVLLSCIANAVNNNHVKEDDLTIKAMHVDEGPAFKRWHPASRGMAHGYKKRTSHITVVLQSKLSVQKPGKENVVKQTAVVKEEDKKQSHTKEQIVPKMADLKQQPKQTVRSTILKTMKGVRRGTKG